MLRAAAFAALTFATLASAKHHHGGDDAANDLFQKCFCWDNSTNYFCGGSTWYNTADCRDWAIVYAWWTIPAVLLATAFFALPLLFLAFRYCCNCCGGRKPSYDCCCPSDAAVEAFPGYRPRTVWCHRIFFFVLFGGMISMGVHTFIQNNTLHRALGSTVDDVRGAFSAWSRHADDCETAFTTLVSAGYATAEASARASATARASSRLLSDFNQGYSDAWRYGESNQYYGRRAILNAIVALPLVFLSLVAILLACVCCRSTGFPIAVTGSCFSFSAGVLTLAAIVFGALAVGTRVACDNWAETTTPFLLGQLKEAQVCGVPAFVAAANATVNNFNDRMLTELCPLIAQAEAVGYSSPAPTPCRAGGLPVVAQTTGATAATSARDVQMYVTYVVQLAKGNEPLIACVGTSNSTNQTCPPAVTAAATALMGFPASALVTIATEVIPRQYECGAAAASLGVGSPIQSDVCGPLKGSVSRIGAFLGGSVALAFVLTIVMGKLIKRYRTWAHPLREALPETPLCAPGYAAVAAAQPAPRAAADATAPMNSAGVVYMAGYGTYDVAPALPLAEEPAPVARKAPAPMPPPAQV